jgi:hypothetical protein
MVENSILFIFEGQTSEALVAQSLKSVYFNESTIITCAFCQDIYQLYNILHEDEDLDLFNLLKELEFNQASLNNYNRDDFAEIYLFFDYDGHACQAEDEKLMQLIHFFNEETDHGKLFISYPMLESLRHISSEEDFISLCVPAKTNIRYKNRVHQEGDRKYQNLNKYDKACWNNLLRLHLSKLNFIVKEDFIFPNEQISQRILFENQMEKFIKPLSFVSVISGFPAFVHEYFPLDELKKMIEE